MRVSVGRAWSTIATVDPVVEARRLLLRLLVFERDAELLRERWRAGELDGEELDRRLDERDPAVEEIVVQLDEASGRLLQTLPEPHAIALRRYFEARRIGREHDDGFLLLATDRAFEEVGLGLGLLPARWLRVRREARRIEVERCWAANARARPDVIEEVLDRTAAASAHPGVHDLFPWLEPARRFLAALLEDERDLAPGARAPCRAASAAITAAMEEQRPPSLAILRRAIVDLDVVVRVRRGSTRPRPA